jgi:hypothetical protein
MSVQGTRPKSAHEIAQVIADDLFTNHEGAQADRLVLWVDADERNLGGWAKRVVIDRIVTALRPAGRMEAMTSLSPALVGDPLTSELLDLIRLMPDHQVDEIIKFVSGLREARGKGRRVTLGPEPPSADERH